MFMWIRRDLLGNDFQPRLNEFASDESEHSKHQTVDNPDDHGSQLKSPNKRNLPASVGKPTSRLFPSDVSFLVTISLKLPSLKSRVDRGKLEDVGHP